MKEEQFTAWAIDTHSKEGHGIIGRYWFGHQPMPEHEGCRGSLFKTRKIAREYLPKVKGEKGDGKFHAFPKAQVIKVKVTISEAL